MEENIKNTARIISMVLILLLVINCFGGCTLAIPLVVVAAGGSHDDISGAFLVGGIIDCALIVASIVLPIVIPISKAAKARHSVKHLENDYFVQQIEKSEYTAAVDSLFNKDTAFTDMYNSLSEAEFNSIIETINSWDKTNVDFFITTLNTLSEDEITSSTDFFNSFPNEEYKKYFFVNAFQPQRWVPENN